MIFTNLIINNYKKFQHIEVPLNKDVNIIVGNNESGKSTILEAITIVTTNKLYGKQIQYCLSSDLFNRQAVVNFLEAIKNETEIHLPEIEIELYAEDIELNADYKGKNNSKTQNVPGIKLSIKFNESYSEVYKELVKNKKLLDLPIEFYKVEWKSFKGEIITSFNKLCNVSMIDTSQHNYNSLIGTYINEDILNILSDEDQKNLGMAYRLNKAKFSENESIDEINKLLTEKSFLNNKKISLELSETGINSWKKELCLSIDGVPYSLSGKGTQNIVKINLALNKIKEKSNLILIEEPENHLSYSNMANLINDICKYKSNKQIFIVTHSNFIANKMGLRDLILINEQNVLRFDNLSEETVEYFMKLPGFDTLRLILSNKPILVEGPSDELVLQKAYHLTHKCLPIEDGVDVISVKGLSFLRFCEIAEAIKKEIRIVTDNDGDYQHNIVDKYKKYQDSKFVKVYSNSNDKQNTLEPSFVYANKLEILTSVLNYKATNQEELISIMLNNKTDWALRLFDSDNIDICFPEYINECIKK